MILWQNRDIQTLLPLTVKQISNAIAGENGKSEFSIDGVDVTTVSFSFSKVFGGFSASIFFLG